MKTDEKTGDTSLYSDLVSLLEELCCAEKHAQNNIEHNREKNPARSERWRKIAEELRNERFKWQTLLDSKKYSYEELHCETKHLLTASKNFSEVANKIASIDSNWSKLGHEGRIKMLNIVLEMNEIG